jgi:hypothetical protein
VSRHEPFRWFTLTSLVANATECSTAASIEPANNESVVDSSSPTTLSFPDDLSQDWVSTYQLGASPHAAKSEGVTGMHGGETDQHDRVDEVIVHERVVVQWK